MNITEVTFNGAKRTTTKRLYQYDYGQILQFTDLELPEEFECDFAVDRCGNSETYLGENNQIQIPNKYLATGNAVVGYIYLHTGEDDGETVYIFTVPVSPRPERNDPIPSSEQKSRIDTLIEQMDEAVQTAEASAESAQQSAEEAQAWAEAAQESAESIDMSNYATKAELETARSELSSAIGNVGTSVTRLGNDTVHLSAQTLTDVQKAQARTNIGAVSADDIPVAVSSDRYGSYAYENGDVSAKAVNSYNMSCAVELGTNNTLRHNLNMALARGLLAMTWVESTSTTDYANGSGDCTQKVQFFVERWSNTLSNHIGSLSDASDCYFSETYDVFTEGDVVYDSNDQVLATIKDASDSTIVAKANDTFVVIGMAYCDDINAQRPVAREINVSVTFSANVPTWTVTMSKIKALTLNGSDFDMRTLRSDYPQKAPQMNNNIIKSRNDYLTTVVQNGVGVALLKSTDCFDWEFVYHVPDKNAHLEASCVGLKYVSNNTPSFLIATRHRYKDGFITIHCMSGESVGATEIDTIKIPASTSRVQFAQTRSTIGYQPYNSYALLCYSLNGRKNGVVARIDSNGEATNAINIVTTEVSNMSNYNVACVSGDVVFYGGANGLQKEKNGVSICHLLRPSATAMSQAKKNLADIITQGSVATVDSSLSPTSTNPVQNSVIYNAIGDIETLLASI